MMNDQPFDITRLHAAYGQGATPAEMLEVVFARLDAANDPGIFLHILDRDSILAEIQKLGPFDPVAKPLWGVPFAIKDNIDAAEMPTTAACPEYAYVPKKDAFVVQALRQAGAILIGKTNLDQFATGLVGVRTPYPVPKNAIDPEIVPGGSSSGSAVAVGHGIVSFALGTDTAGSGRVPAALNNIVGLKPTLGALSNTGVVPACRTLDTISIFALTVNDAHTVLGAAARFDPEDAYARPFAWHDLAEPPSTFTVGVPNAKTRLFFDDQVQADAFAAALDELKALGGNIIEIDFTAFYDVANMLYEGAWTAERYAVIEDILKKTPEIVHPVTKQIIQAAETYSSADVFRGFYRLQDLKRLTDPLIDGVDMLCVPTIPTFYTVADLNADPIGPNSRLGTYTNFVNLLDMCGIAVPTVPRGDNRPGSVTFLARAGRDSLIAAVGKVMHEGSQPHLGATNWNVPATAELTPTADPDEIAVAVVGAHMSGLPLNRELTERGSRFLYAAKTAPSYRLYSLPGGPPVRPGLIQDADGAAIELEVWAMPVARFGDFMKGIPAPLGIGTVTLNTGEGIKGFLCEPSGLVGAEDVTAHGGWRNYLDSLTPPLDKKTNQ